MVRSFRFRLLRLSDEDHILTLVFTHMIMDGWSLGIFNRELSAFYEAISAGRTVELTELPFQPVDVACWEREYLKGPEAQQQIGNWRNHLAVSAPAMSLQGDGPNRDPVDFLCVHRVIRGSPETQWMGWENLQGGRQYALDVLFAAAVAMLRQSTGQEDIRVNIPLTARTRPEVQGLIGCFRRRLLLRIDVSGQPSFENFLYGRKISQRMPILIKTSRWRQSFHRQPPTTLHIGEITMSRLIFSSE